MTELDSTRASDRHSAEVLDWLMRCYKTQERWKNLARRIFFLSNGDSVLSRTRVAGRVRQHFVEGKPKTEDVERWQESYEGTTKVQIEPPKVSASNAGYVDWLYIADYLLLPCSSPTERFQEENQRRDTEFQQLLGSYQIRMQVHGARGLIEKHADKDDDQILDLLKRDFVKASLANVKEARRLDASNASRNKPLEPEKPPRLDLYASVYFATMNTNFVNNPG